ncbi:hypothetical protein J0X14_14445 [Muricauda sp. CAU 1633]|uniref:hypothetical protein n=1 Tax=Allomuricauda sp. CAU 1633 TaxID=2816036 RepID=UPI001A8E6B93|nr:hypothetical protein [Muricauda sp. CAU 1633]MBO0323505.1 hypothetical protein [Muricauda sp. CAU 1633]
MEPKERAKEIYDKMKGFRVKNSHRKKCALVAVDIILKDVGAEDWLPDEELGINYWQAVRKEIEKL